MEVNLIARAKIIEPRLPIGRLQETQTRTLAMTGLQPLALTTLAGQSLLLQTAETVLLRTIKHLRQTIRTDVAKLVLRKDKVVAGIHISVLLHDGCMTAFLGIDTNARFGSHPTGQRGIEELHKDLADIPLHPFIEDGAHEPSPLFRTNAERSYGTILIEELGKMPTVAMLLDALHNRTDLQELALEFIAEKAIEADRVLGVVMIGRRHRIPLHAIFAEHPDALHHSFPSAITLSIKPISVVLLLSSVNTDAYEPTLIMKELAPFWREMESVRLNTVADALASAIIPLQPNCLLIETEGLEHRFATMPSEEHIWSLLNLDIVADVLLEEFVRHAALLLFREMLLLQIIAILATQITHRTCRLCHDIKRTGKRIGGGHEFRD